MWNTIKGLVGLSPTITLRVRRYAEHKAWGRVAVIGENLDMSSKNQLAIVVKPDGTATGCWAKNLIPSL
jgi:hypothetical protein